MILNNISKGLALGTAFGITMLVVVFNFLIKPSSKNPKCTRICLKGDVVSGTVNEKGKQIKNKTITFLCIATMILSILNTVPVTSAESNTYTGCLFTSGLLRGTIFNIAIGSSPVVTCRSSVGQTQVSWNQIGPIGLTGSTGPMGKQGPAGKDGLNGTDGKDGAPGLQGPAGEGGISNFTKFSYLLNQDKPVQDIPFDAMQPVSCKAISIDFLIKGEFIGQVLGFDGTEKISDTYEYHIAVRTESPLLDPANYIGRNGQLTITRGKVVTSIIGVIDQFGLASYDKSGAVYSIRIVPALSQLKYNQKYKIYQSVDYPSIVKSVLADSSISYQDKLSYNHELRDFTMQYKETDFNFVSRLMESEGTFYYFSGDHETMVLGDDNTAFDSSNKIALDYRGHLAPGEISEEYVRTFHKEEQQTIKIFEEKSYDFEYPALLIEGKSTNALGIGELYKYGLDFKTVAQARAAARTDAEIQAADRTPYVGTSTASSLRAGQILTLNDLTEAGLSNDYIVTSVHQAALAESGDNCFVIGNEFSVIPLSTQYSPEMKTKKPIATLTTSVVTGPAGQDRYVDGYGRVKVQFHWDREGKKNESSSAWIRVASPYAGKDGFGMIFYPQIGNEVVVDFLEGNPDQPIIVGSVYNGLHIPPKPLPYDAMNHNQDYIGVIKGDLNFIGNQEFSGNVNADNAEMNKLTVNNLTVKGTIQLPANTLIKIGDYTLQLDSSDGNLSITTNASMTVRVGGNYVVISNATN
jgi:type VI secretion system VgrG family protein